MTPQRLTAWPWTCPSFDLFPAARPMIATLPLRPSVNNGALLPKKGSGTLPSPSGSGSRKDSSTAACKRWGANVANYMHCSLFYIIILPFIYCIFIFILKDMINFCFGTYCKGVGREGLCSSKSSVWYKCLKFSVWSLVLLYSTFRSY